MKKNIALLLVCSVLSIQYVFAQDKIIKLNGESVSCTITEISDSSVKYKLKDEELNRNMSLFYVQELLFSNGAVEKINEKVEVNSIEDWNKVVVINEENRDMKDFKLGETYEFEKKTRGTGGSTASRTIRSHVLNEIKRMAARDKNQMIKITGSEKQIQRFAGKRTIAFYIIKISAVGYSYN